MRLLIVSQYFYPENFKINDLALSLKSRGHEVTVLTGLPNYPSGKWFEGYGYHCCGQCVWEGIPVIRVPLVRRGQGRGWQLALNYLSFVFFSCLLAPWYLRRKRFDAIFVYEPSPFTVAIPAMLLRSLKKAPLFFWVQDLWPESLQAAGAVHSPHILKAVGRMVTWIYRHCDRVLVQSEAFVEPVVQAGAARERISYFPNWAESLYQPLKKPDTPCEYSFPESHFHVVFAGNLGEAQSLETIILAASFLKSHQKIRWVIIGDGRRASWMKEQVERQGLRTSVLFLGRHPAVTMPAFFAMADVLLVTLKADEVFAHTIPSKVQSYMACAKPIVAALNGEGARVIRKSESGLAVAAEDSEGLAQAVLKLSLFSDEKKQMLGKNAHAYYARHFDREILVTQLESWMKEAQKDGVCGS